jgi:serine/threonine protein kinase
MGMNAEALIGTVLGTCTLQQLIGQGGMGAVFLAQQSRPRRQVAVKVLLPMVQLTPTQHAAFLERFRRETDAAASLDHPNILPVYEYGERDGLAYLVMPYVSGGTLRDELEREKQLPLPKIISYLDQMAAALDTAHARGVIHRDVKPANILMTPERRLLLSDFGLVKIISDSTKTPLTKVGMPMGTPDYMAPEQVIGLEVDGRADIYSLGVILYQMITGILPFRGEMPMQVAMQHLHIAPPSPRQYRPELSPAAEQVILRVLAKLPTDRYARALDLANSFRLSMNFAAAGMGMGEEPYTLFGAATAQLSTPRGLLDPGWQMQRSQFGQFGMPQGAPPGQPDQQAPSAFTNSGMPSGLFMPVDNSPQNNIVAQTKMTLPSFTGLFSPQPILPSTSTSAPTAPKVVGETPLPPTRPLMRKTGLLRPMNLLDTSDASATQSSDPASAPGISLSPESMAAQMPPAQLSQMPPVQMPPMPAQLSPTTPQVPFPTEGPGFNPLSPFPATNAPGANSTANSVSGLTGSLALPGEYVGQGNTTTLRLTQSVKIVKMPVAGQPGRYVTGLLHMPAPPPAPEQKAPAGRVMRYASMLYSRLHMEKAHEYLRASGAYEYLRVGKAYAETHLKKLALIATVVLVIASSCIFLLVHNTPSSVTQTHGPKPTPNITATAMVEASATADANIILADPLSQNIHNWPVSTNTKGPQTYVFKDGAYHITDTDTADSALSSLPPDEPLPSSFVYTVTMEEIKGDDTQFNNQFGLVFRLSTHQQGGKVLTTFYAFVVANTPGGQYLLYKFDDSYSVNPWTTLWSHPFGREYHYGHGAAGKNTFSVAIQGKKFTFVVNGKVLGSAQDDSLQNGQIGLLVNWGGTEVAFSNLLLTYK